jgi:hypothetical protein
MSDSHAPECNRDIQLENFAAELTSAAYPLALRQGITSSWINVELGLWRALAGTVKKWVPERPPPQLPQEIEAWREGLLVELTKSALYVAARHGTKGSLLQVELGLYRTFRLVIRRRLTKARYS